MEDLIMAFQMLVHLDGGRMGVVGEKGWPEVPTEDGKGFDRSRLYFYRPRSSPMHQWLDKLKGC